jgi:hypothetical protein
VVSDTEKELDFGTGSCYAHFTCSSSPGNTRVASAGDTVSDYEKNACIKTAHSSCGHIHVYNVSSDYSSQLISLEQTDIIITERVRNEETIKNRLAGWKCNYSLV